MNEKRYDVAIIGAGTAGLAAFRAAEAEGARPLLIEAGPGGTTCAKEGCMPSKLLIAAAEAADLGARADALGVRTSIEVDGVAVMDRVRRERDRFVGFVQDSHQAIPEAQRLRGRARFLSDQVLEVGGQRIEARTIVIATGSRPKPLPLLDTVRDRVLASRDVFEWTDLPESVAVFGPGVIGLELGQALARLGVRVKIFGVGGAVGPLTDPEVRDDALAALRQHVWIDPDARVQSVLRDEQGVRIEWLEDDEVRAESFEYVLSAIGRVPNLDGLGLENTSAPLNRQGHPHFDPNTLRIPGTNLFVAGDANADRSPRPRPVYANRAV